MPIVPYHKRKNSMKLKTNLKKKKKQFVRAKRKTITWDKIIWYGVWQPLLPCFKWKHFQPNDNRLSAYTDEVKVFFNFSILHNKCLFSNLIFLHCQFLILNFFFILSHCSIFSNYNCQSDIVLKMKIAKMKVQQRDKT